MWCGPHSIRYDRVNMTGEMKNVARSCLEFISWCGILEEPTAAKKQ